MRPRQGCWIFILPELPEVETVARSLAPHVRGAAITAVNLLHSPSLHNASLPLDSIIGATIESVDRRGKLVILRLRPVDAARGPSLLIFHLRMTGRLLVNPPAAGRHCRCVFNLRHPGGAGGQLVFDDVRTFGKIMATTPERLAAWDFWARLGPEPLEMDPDALLPRLKGCRPIKSALLDQETIAGVGNIYADESLFRAAISPGRPAGSIEAAESRLLMASIQEILKTAIEKGGSSIRDYVDAQGKSGGFQNSFAVYGRGGLPCVKCGSQLQKIKIAGRSTVFCPFCQK